ncbi:hypothetical protein V9T40_003313 [Parthenolecanium corni]|uniref:Transposase domain-containing protein n=1 Tax=Parthenolecanium corni TaxID=536013 RepID=A0AAN9U0Y2_9HEMI
MKYIKLSDIPVISCIIVHGQSPSASSVKALQLPRSKPFGFHGQSPSAPLSSPGDAMLVPLDAPSGSSYLSSVNKSPSLPSHTSEQLSASESEGGDSESNGCETLSICGSLSSSRCSPLPLDMSSSMQSHISERVSTFEFGGGDSEDMVDNVLSDCTASPTSSSCLTIISALSSSQESHTSSLPNIFNSSVDDSATDLNASGSEDMTATHYSTSQDLMAWAVSNGIRRKARNELLQILRNFDPEEQRNLPKDFRTLFAHQLNTTIVELADKQMYAYFGIENMLNDVGISQAIFGNEVMTSDHVVELTLHVDGLPLFNSSSIQFWPLLGSVRNTVFIIGVYCGPTKPSDYKILTSDGVSEIVRLYDQGITIKGVKCHFRVKLFSADAPARAAVLNVKGHSGYSSCIKCWTKGESSGTTIYFPQVDARLRTNEEFVNCQDEDLHHGPSDLARIPNFDFIKMVPFDYMHSVCLGVMKKFLHFWTKPSGARSVVGRILSGTTLLAINQHLTQLAEEHYCPMNFARFRPRSFQHLPNFKATEYRQVLLYTGPVIFYKRLYGAHWKIMVNLNVIFRMLCQLSLQESQPDRNKILQFTERRLKWLVCFVVEMYGVQSASFNLHSLIHLPDDCSTFGSVDNFSCFMFEAFLYKVKRSIRTGNKPLQQLINRYAEYLFSLRGSSTTAAARSSPQLLSRVVDGSCELYHRYMQCKYLSMHLRGDREGNRYVKVRQEIYVRIDHCLQRIEDNEVFIEGFAFLSFADLFTKPVPSRRVGTVVVTPTNGIVDRFNIHDIVRMCYPMPLTINNIQKLVLTELLHKDEMEDIAWTDIREYAMMSDPVMRIAKFKGSKFLKKFVIADDGLGLFVSPTSWIDLPSKKWYYPSETLWQKKAKKNAQRRSVWPCKALRLISNYEFDSYDEATELINALIGKAYPSSTDSVSIETTHTEKQSHHHNRDHDERNSNRISSPLDEEQNNVSNDYTVISKSALDCLTFTVDRGNTDSRKEHKRMRDRLSDIGLRQDIRSLISAVASQSPQSMAQQSTQSVAQNPFCDETVPSPEAIGFFEAHFPLNSVNKVDAVEVALKNRNNASLLNNYLSSIGKLLCPAKRMKLMLDTVFDRCIIKYYTWHDGKRKGDSTTNREKRLKGTPQLQLDLLEVPSGIGDVARNLESSFDSNGDNNDEELFPPAKDDVEGDPENDPEDDVIRSPVPPGDSYHSSDPTNSTEA